MHIQTHKNNNTLLQHNLQARNDSKEKPTYLDTELSTKNKEKKTQT